MAELLAHLETPCAHVRAFHGSVTRAAGALAVRYRIEGAIERLLIPDPQAPTPGERLWAHTCCELFFALEGAQAYREFNFSPSGQWAAYAFQRYREGGPLAVDDPGIVVRRSPGRLELEARVPAPAQTLRVALCAVIEDRDRALSYWALRHAPGKPDFHRAEAFALEVA